MLIRVFQVSRGQISAAQSIVLPRIVGLELRSGGGIVIDSEPEAERLETLAKARAFNTQPDLWYPDGPS